MNSGRSAGGKSFIRFTKVDQLNLETMKKILVKVNNRYVAGEKLYGGQSL